LAVSHAMKEAGVPTIECIEYLDNVLGIIENTKTKTKRAIAVVEESIKWVALSD
jgi:hypothetical protein